MTEAARRAKTKADLLGVAIRAARDLGFSHCAYVTAAPFPFSQRRTFALNNWPAKLREAYAAGGYESVDPALRACRRSDLPFVWSDSAYADVPQLRREFLDHGLAAGWSLGVHGSNGPRSVFSLARALSPLSTVEVARKERDMRCLALAVHDAAQRLNSVEPLAVFTDRERLVMRWTADGKTVLEIARILEVSENTVKFHLKNATEKMQVANKTAAVAKAAVMGWLD